MVFETMLSTSKSAAKVAKQMLRKQSDRSMNIHLFSKTILAELEMEKMVNVTLDDVTHWIEQSNTFEISTENSTVCLSKKKKRKRVNTDTNSDGRDAKIVPDDSDKGDVVPAAIEVDLQALEDCYRNALAAFKADKKNKDLRRSKSTARKAWDKAVAATSQEGSIQLTCKDCSQSFIFTKSEQDFYAKEMSFDTVPTRCQNCNQALKHRCHDRSKLDSHKSNPNGKNMCYAFQQGKCKHGNKCKFSHNPDFGGSPGTTSITIENSS